MQNKIITICLGIIATNEVFADFGNWKIKWGLKCEALIDGNFSEWEK